MASGELAIPEFEDDIDYLDLVIQFEIGQGAFGKVFKGIYFGTDVAIKQIALPPTPEEKTFLKREVAILKGIRHPNTVQFIGVTTDPNGASVIVTDYVPGGNLRSVLKDNERQLSWEWRVNIAADVAGGMAYLHAKNIIFRDLKSKNILVHGNRAKICDFGLARATQAIRPMTICGTDDWMAPEVILGMDYGTQADVFSYGIVLLEIISRAKVAIAMQRTPMDAFGLNEDKILSILPPNAPPEFTALALECCTYEPKKRPLFKNIVQYLNNLAKIVPKDEGLPPPAPATTPTPSVGAPPVRTPPTKGMPTSSSPRPKQAPTSAMPGKAPQPASPKQNLNGGSVGAVPQLAAKGAPKSPQPKAKISVSPSTTKSVPSTGIPKASPKPASPKAIPGLSSPSASSTSSSSSSTSSSAAPTSAPPKLGMLNRAQSAGGGLTATPAAPKAVPGKAKQWPPVFK